MGFGAPFEAKVATALSAFCLRFDQQHDGLWLAVDAAGIQGSVIISGRLTNCTQRATCTKKHGFLLACTQRRSQWGKEVNEQLFMLDGA